MTKGCAQRADLTKSKIKFIDLNFIVMQPYKTNVLSSPLNGLIYCINYWEGFKNVTLTTTTA